MNSVDPFLCVIAYDRPLRDHICGRISSLNDKLGCYNHFRGESCGKHPNCSNTFDQQVVLDRLFSFVEQILNYAGVVPMIGVISGALRCVFGGTQFIVGVIAIFVMGAMGTAFRQDSSVLERGAFYAAAILAHGFMNVVRGLVEMSSRGVFLICLYEIIFRARISYKNETNLIVLSSPLFFVHDLLSNLLD